MEWIAHVAGVVLWLGGLMAAGLMRGPEQPGQGSTRRRAMTAMALPGLILVLLGGVGLLARFGISHINGPGWFHTKMLLVVTLVVLHVLVARDKVRGAWLMPVTGLVGLGAVVLAHLKPF